jgi:hypothetical protein
MIGGRAQLNQPSFANSRNHVLDAIKLFFFFHIVAFDAFSAIFGYLKDWPYQSFAGITFGYSIMAPFSYSGLGILALFVYLTGRKNLRLQWVNLLILTFVAFLALSFTEGGFKWFSLIQEWDIYHYLFVSYLLMTGLARMSPGILGQLLILLGSFLLLSLDYSQGTKLVDFPSLRAILFGSCRGDGRGGWFLFPWIFLVPFYFSLGRYFDLQRKMPKLELLVWVIALIGGLSSIYAFANPPLVGSFYCYIFSVPPWKFILISALYFFLIRLEDLYRLVPRLGMESFLAISNLSCCRHFGLAFLVHIFWSQLLGVFSRSIQEGPVSVLLYIFGSIIAVEIITRWIHGLLSWSTLQIQRTQK